MQKSMFRKRLVLGIIILFIGASFTSSISGFDNVSKEDINNFGSVPIAGKTT